VARSDEARHVAIALAHLARHARAEPGLRGRLARAGFSADEAAVLSSLPTRNFM
jgi:hypothetical protein